MNEVVKDPAVSDSDAELKVFESSETGLLSYVVVCGAEALLIDVSDDVALEVSRWCSERGGTPVYSSFTSGTSSRSRSNNDLHQLAAELGLGFAPDVDCSQASLLRTVRAEIKPVAPWASEHSEPRLVLSIGDQLVELDSTLPSGGAPVCLVIEEGVSIPPVLCVQELQLVVGGTHARLIPLDGRAQRVAVSVGPYLFTGSQGAHSSVGLQRLRDLYPKAIEHGRRRARSRRASADLWRPDGGYDDVKAEIPLTGEGDEWGMTTVIPFERRVSPG